MTYKVPIEKDVPLDSIVETRKRMNKYPWKDMEIGDSFLFGTDAYATLAYSLVRQANKFNQPKKFVMKRFNMDGIERFRCWRVL